MSEGDDDSLKNVMGFSSFGESKKPREFDFMKIFEEAKRIAKERNVPPKKEAQPDSATPSSSTEQGKTSNNTSPPPITPPISSANDQDEDDVVENTSAKETFVPIEFDITLMHGSKPITAIALDPAGSRLITGGWDFDVKWWDFVGMESNNLRPFKCQQPVASHQIRQLAYSCNGEFILVVGGSAQAKIITRDGEMVAECNKGYQYITNPSSAKGHTHQLTDGHWHPRERDEFLTSSLDGTVRMWNLSTAETLMYETKLPTHTTCLKVRSDQGRRTAATACTYSPDASLIGAACQDGSIQFWDHRRKMYVNHALIQRHAHCNNTEIGCIAFSYDCRQFATRAMDDTLKLWDVRKISQAVHAVHSLPTLFGETNCTFSPNDKLIATAVSVHSKGEKNASVKFYRRDTMELVETYETMHESVVRILWHPRINQMVLSHADGAVSVHYDMQYSHGGAKLCAFRTRNKNKNANSAGDGSYAKPVLLTYDEETEKAARKGWRGSKYHQVDIQRPNYKKMVPARPETVAGSKGASLHQYMVQQIVLPKCEDPAEKDIRAAILRHAEDAEKNPRWNKAYLLTQPKPIFQKTEEDVAEPKKPRLN